MGNKLSFTSTRFKKNNKYKPTRDYIAFDREKLLELKVDIVSNERSSNDLKDFVDTMLGLLGD